MQCISREQRMLSVPHADALAVVLMLFLDPRASRYQDANAAPDIPTRRRLKAEHERVRWLCFGLLVGLFRLPFTLRDSATGIDGYVA